jgi:teichuronic acid biosynthesis glycosyltransferase TuaH
VSHVRASPQRDVVFSFAFETWRGALERRAFSPDLLAEALFASSRVGRLLVVDPWRTRLGRWRAGTDVVFPQDSNHELLSPLRVRRRDPVSPSAAFRSARRLLAGARRRALAMHMERPTLIATHPVIAAAADYADWARITYYGWDDWLAHPAMQRWWPAFAEAYEAMRRNRVRVVAVTQTICDRIGSSSPSLVVPNGVREAEWREPVNPPERFRQLPAPRLLYSGTIDSRLDIPAVRAIAAAYPDATVLLVGTLADRTVRDAFAEFRNVDIWPNQPRPVIRGLTWASDVALLAHVDSPLVRAMSPLKLYEYLAAGRPVVASDLPEVRALPGIFRAQTPDEFVSQVAAARARGPADEASRQAFVAANSWKRRMDTLIDFALAPES